MKKDILKHFQKKDPVLYKYALKHRNMEIPVKDIPENYFHRLCHEIVNQQLSGKAGDSIFNRLITYIGKKIIYADDILMISQKELRSTGLSNAKAKYLTCLAEAVKNSRLDFSGYDKMPDQEVVKDLIKVKGIGQWTAEMFLIFVLGRENVFSIGDLGLKKGLVKLYGLSREPTTDEIETIVKSWEPYKTYGSLLLWKVLDDKVG